LLYFGAKYKFKKIIEGLINGRCAPQREHLRPLPPGQVQEMGGKGCTDYWLPRQINECVEKI